MQSDIDHIDPPSDKELIDLYDLYDLENHDQQTETDTEELSDLLEEQPTISEELAEIEQAASHTSSTIKINKQSLNSTMEFSKTSNQNKPAKKNQTQIKNVQSLVTTHQEMTLPVTHAQYLNNPHPAYPRKSKLLGEQGKVTVSVLIDIDGTAAQGFVHQSSGFKRLDETALSTVLKWRFIAGRKAGILQKMWVNIPINFILE